ncbi:hypothetical protein [Paenibacillus herberti]|uniref:Uncharacterized protein n=1 Tax=Paenibacillus herberti TaxID=1619309 RepID=A0A229P0X0_9BACL|nr:hypothetical protein [Paenibacillus herberti]OXM15539.1 hypothetical protein CGZ75_02030 [Paenibacillus herberti]
MSTVIITVLQRDKPEKSIDVNISLNLSAVQLAAILKENSWLQEEEAQFCEVSETGDQWSAVRPESLLSAAIHGDGALIRFGRQPLADV